MTEYRLHEHTNSAFHGDSEDLSNLLQKIWDNRERQPYYLDDENDKEDLQQLLSIIYSSKGEATIKAKHYVGIIKTLGQEPTTINILPKIYKDQNIPDDRFNNDLLLWLKYSKKIRLPKYKSGANRLNNDLLEVFIYMFASYTKKLFTTNLYQNYTDISRDLSVVRGRINMPRYIRNISQGNMHRISCDYQRYQLDNNFNRIVKYVAKFLIKISNDKTTKRHLKDIIFLLDEVKDKAVRSSDCDKVRFNQIFSDHQTVLDYCRLFLSNSVSYGSSGSLKVFVMLFDMNVLFEEFIAGFIINRFPDMGFRSQSSNKYLTECSRIRLKPDVVSDTHIIDTKYKILHDSKSISQSDMYQLTAYAVRYGIDRLTLLYPMMQGSDNALEYNYTINNSICESQTEPVSIHIRQIDITRGEAQIEKDLTTLFN